MNWLAVAVGGALGALARYGLSAWLPASPGQFPWPTFCANILGCFAMGVLYVLVVDKHILPPLWRPFLMVGLLGALTTFSTFSLEALALWQMHKAGLALLYTGASLAGSILAVATGYRLTEIFTH